LNARSIGLDLPPTIGGSVVSQCQSNTSHLRMATCMYISQMTPGQSFAGFTPTGSTAAGAGRRLRLLIASR
jgi:hypothetical protein